MPTPNGLETIDAVVKSLDGATTLMLCDIPLSLGGPQGVLVLLVTHGLADTVDYLYLPRGYGRKSKRRCSGSLSAFVNFSSQEAAVRAVQVFHSMQLEDRRVYVCRAAAQGIAANLMHFRSVRYSQPLLETAWPMVRIRGELVETAPAEVAKQLNLEQELDQLRSADASTCSSKGSNSPKAQQVQRVSEASCEPSCATIDPAWSGLPNYPDLSYLGIYAHDAFPAVSPEQVAAFATLLQPEHSLDTNWWTGRLDWTLGAAEAH